MLRRITLLSTLIPTLLLISVLNLPAAISADEDAVSAKSASDENQGLVPPLNSAEREIAAKLSSHIKVLAGDIGARSLTRAPENLNKAASYIEDCFNSLSLMVTSQVFTVQSKTMEGYETSKDSIKFSTVEHDAKNVIAEIKGTTRSDEIIVIGAHYDSVYDCPAANDNASGVAAMLEIARLLAGEKLPRTIRFVAFTNEEPPFFMTDDMGSYRYAKACRKNGDKIVGMLSLETMGYYSDMPHSQKFPMPGFGLFFPNKGNFISFVSNFHSRRLLKKCACAFRKAVEFPLVSTALPSRIPGVGYSDQRSFWTFGYPALMVTDTAPYRYPRYHEQTDTPDKIKYDHLARVTFGLSHAVRELASK